MEEIAAFLYAEGKKEASLSGYEKLKGKEYESEMGSKVSDVY